MRNLAPPTPFAGRHNLPVTPKGMGDLLPPFAGHRRDLSRRLLNEFALSGYELVTAPLFEHAAVIEQGKDASDGRDLLRFVEPESGEVAVLRPDITPQIARIVATRLAPERPPPYRLSYEGRILRRRRGRARNHRQIAQVGLECIGIGGAGGEIETIGLAAEACRRVGLNSFRIELCTSALARAVLDCVPLESRALVAELVATKDTAALRTEARSAGADKLTVARLEALIEHYGDRDVLRHARKTFRWAGARQALDGLSAVTEGLTHKGLGDQIHVDLSETRGLTYYTGTSFQIFAEGPGEAVCGGGRYDDLLARFGTPLPATGFAIDLENLLWALRSSGASYASSAHKRLAFVVDSPEHARLASQLRSSGICVAELSKGTTAKDALAFAASWGYDAALVPSRAKIRVRRLCDGKSRTLDITGAASHATLIEWAFADKD